MQGIESQVDNMESPVFHAAESRMIVAGWLLASLVCWGISGALLRNAFKDQYPDLGIIIMSLLAALGAALLLKRALQPGNVTAYKDRIALHSVLPWFNRTVYWKDIVTWYQKEVKSKGITNYTLVVRHTGGVLKLRSAGYEPEVYAGLVEWFKTYSREREAQPGNGWDITYRGLAIAAAVCIAVFIPSFHSWQKGFDPVQASGITEISGIMAHDGRISKASKGANSISIALSNFPNWRFSFDQAAYNATNKAAYTAEVRKGDTVLLGIATEAYQKKIAGSRRLSTWDKIWGFRSIDVLTLRDRERAYLTLKAYSKEGGSAGSEWLMYFSVVGLCTVLGALVYKSGNS